MHLIDLLTHKKQELRLKFMENEKNIKGLKFFTYFLLILIVFTLTAKAIGKHYGFVFVISESIDKRIVFYSVIDKAEMDMIKKDKLILFNLYKKTRYTTKNLKLVKYPACKEGDILEVKNKKYFCNNQYINTARDFDSNNLKLDNFVFNGVIPKGKIFVVGTHEKSFDSRYFGFIDIGNIKGIEL